MSKKKHKQNQSLVSDETKNKVVSDSQQNATQPDATNPQEHGRSMTEMLGVLAVIGVLSIGGVQGYRYAMNKYHSNEVINELNILNAQLAIFMSGIHDDESVMSLGEPYDNGEKIKTGGYAFTYGCGQDPDSNSPCDLDETGYYMTLDGVPEDVCKSASQMTANMMNLVEQRINGHTDNNGILCQDGDNQLVFLFDANEGQGFDNENDNNPDVTLPKEEEETTTTTTFETTTTTTDTYTKTKTGTYTKTKTHTWTDTDTNTYTETYTDTYTKTVTTTIKKCTSNSDCGVGEYCYLDSYTGCVTSSTGMSGVCRNANSDLKSKPQFLPVLSSTNSMTWWSAKNFCQALGKTPLSPSDIGCADSSTTCSSKQVLDLNETYGKSGWIGNNNEAYILRNGGSGESCVSSSYGYAFCKDNEEWYIKECSINSDCNSGEYCDIQNYGTGQAYCTKDSSNMKGWCRNAQADLRDKPTSAPFWMSNRIMKWWSANNFCQALGKTLVELSDFGCAHSFCASGCDLTWGYCHASADQSPSTTAKNDRTPIMQAMYDAYYLSGAINGGDTNTDYNSCKSYTINFDTGAVNNDGLRFGSSYAICK